VVFQDVMWLQLFVLMDSALLSCKSPCAWQLLPDFWRLKPRSALAARRGGLLLTLDSKTDTKTPRIACSDDRKVGSDTADPGRACCTGLGFRRRPGAR
jgi:hypothetical protein